MHNAVLITHVAAAPMSWPLVWQVYGKEKGYCNADQPAWVCPCNYDGIGGPTCDTVFEQTCMNQCNGHGECNLGFCKCHPGW